MNNLNNSIDAIAEREADAIDQLADLTGQPLISGSCSILMARQRDKRITRDDKPAGWCRYPRRAAVRAWLRILKSHQHGQRDERKGFYLETAADRKRQAAQRTARRELLATLKRMNLNIKVTLPQAAAFLSVPTSTIEKWRYKIGDLPSCGRRCVNGRSNVLFRMADVLDAAARRWGGPGINLHSEQAAAA